MSSSRPDGSRRELSDYRFLKPTPANLAKLRPVIPRGYNRSSLHSDQTVKKKKKKK